MDTGGRILEITDVARTHVLDIVAQQDNADKLGLWLEVSGMTGDEFRYDMYLQEHAEASQADVVENDSDLTIVIPTDSVHLLRGSTLDLEGEVGSGTLVLSNPNAPLATTPVPPDQPLAPEPDLSDPLTKRVHTLLEETINPAMASHGGVAELVSVEDGVAYLRLGGGCQGCGMASVTLSQGIEAVLREEVPELTGVVDVTDHSSGTNPYF